MVVFLHYIAGNFSRTQRSETFVTNNCVPFGAAICRTLASLSFVVSVHALILTVMIVQKNVLHKFLLWIISRLFIHVLLRR